MDSANVTTKLFVRPSDDYTTLMGEMNICLSEANPTQENYIFNFDYLKDTNNITKEQIAAIEKHEAELHRINNELYPLENQISVYSNQKIDLEAKYKFYKNSIELDKQQRDSNQDYIRQFTKSDGTENNTIESRNELNPEYVLITTDEQDNYCINLRDKKKGIKPDSVKIYREYDTANHVFIGNQLTGYYFSYDEYGNPERIYGIQPTERSSAVYMAYVYEPILYYQNIIKIWKEKLSNDIIHKDQIKAELENALDNPEGAGVIALLNKAEADKNELLEEKRKLIKKFERFMGPALREGYWQPEDYKDYGQLYENTKTLPQTKSNKIANETTGTNFIIEWDSKLFDEEQDISYYSDLTSTPTYYPMINLSSENVRTHLDFSKLNEYSFIFNNNYYDANADLTSVKNMRTFSVGSEAILGFVEPSNGGNIIPVLILVGAKNMTNEQLLHMLNTTKGHPKLGCIVPLTSQEDLEKNKRIQVQQSSIITLSEGDFITGNANTLAVYPRIKFSSLMLKTNTSDLFIRYKDTLLENYEDYIIRTRNIQSGTYAPEYLVTIKPETILKTGLAWDTTNQVINWGSVKINYILSNASTAIYTDALKVSKENAYPKVSYTIDPNILSKSLLRNLHQKLNWLVMINDVQLKFKNVFGYISKMELDLDFPDKDTIEIKNYKTKFEDLFSTIVAQTESMKHNEGLLSALAGGTYCLQGNSTQSLLQENSTTIEEYLNEYINNSPVVEERLEQLFTEAGAILSDADASLNYNSTLTYENATILSTFASTIGNRLVSHVYRSKDAPNSFHINDIWIQIDDQDNEIKRYRATANSSDVAFSPVLASGQSEKERVHNGWQVIYQGMPAGYTGPTMEVDAVAGNILILAENEVNIHGGDVNILGDRSVNISGVSIRLDSTYYEDPNKEPIETGITLISTEIGAKTALSSIVTIQPKEIVLTGSKITIGTGSFNETTEQLDHTNALLLDPDNGIYIGSNKKISLFTQEYPTSQTVANVEISPAHIYFGMNNVNNGNATAVELTEKHIIFAAGNAISSLDGNNENIAIDNNVAGVKITKDQIGLAVGSGTGRSAIIMNSGGLKIGTAGNSNGTAVSPMTNGSYVSISGGGIEIGSKGTFSANTTNFKVKPNPANNADYFFVGDSSNYIKYTKGSSSNTLSIKGTITATTFKLGNNSYNGLKANDISDFNTAVDARASNFQVDGVSTATWNGKKYVALTAGSDNLQGLLLGVNDGKHIIAASDASTAAVDISKNGIYFDHSTDNYIHLDNTGINIQGAHIRINGEEIWERGDIMWGSTKPAHSGSRSWIWIKPNASAFITYTYSNGNNRTQDITLTVDNGESGFAATEGGNTTYYYTLTLSGKVQQPGSNAFTASVKVLASIADSTTNVIAYGPSETSGPISFPRGSGDTTSACGNITFSWSGSTNLTYGGSNNSAAKSIILHARTNYSGYAFFITYAQLTVRTSSSDAAATPCSVYYFPAGT